jgi:hypothetical protein
MILNLMAALLGGCGLHFPASAGQERSLYRPSPFITISTFVNAEKISAVYIRHTSGNVLLNLTRQGANGNAGEDRVRFVVGLASPQYRKFASVQYEGFEESFDVFDDGRIILVPLCSDNERAVGAFVNLLSGKRYFFVPSTSSGQLVAKVRSFAKRRHGLKVVTPEDVRSVQELARFPESEQ